ncbi:MAG: hypothetical protein GY810_22465 [Aureispira sp.]|nr:hypothetical protein [Aureispira sp.]
MKNSKLIQLLSMLTSRELTRFEDYVYSPFFNKHNELRKLCSYLIKQAPEFRQERKLHKERIYKHLYGAKPFDNNMFYSLFSKLLKLLHEFLIHIEWQQWERQQQIFLMRELRKRLQFRHQAVAQKRYEQAAKPNYVEDLYLEEYWLHKELDLQFVTKGGRVYDSNLQQKNDYLDLFYITEKLKTACDMINRNTIIGTDYQYPLLEELLVHIKKVPQYAELPVIKIYQLILNLLLKPDEETIYADLIQFVVEHNNSFSDEDLRAVYIYALNYCATRINKGQIRYYKESLYLYKQLLGRRLIYVDGYLPAGHYKNILTTAVRTKDFEWAEEFIEERKKDLAPSIRENSYRYNLAFFHHATHQYDKALQALHNVDFVNLSYALGAKIIQIKSYYELDEYEALLSAIEAFTVFLRRSKKIAAYQRQANLNFLKLTGRLCKLREQVGIISNKKYEHKYEELKKGLLELNPVANKDWLENCLNAL